MQNREASRECQVQQEKVIFTGGSGLLGSEIKKLLPLVRYPSSSHFDVTNPDQMEQYVKMGEYSLLVHAAAITSPPRCQADPEKAIHVNVIGTANVVRLCMTYGMRLVYISTDYVFSGTTGRYKENDPLHPVNEYAWSKLGGECAVRLYSNSLIVRTSFGPDVFPYEKAFVDQWTSRETVSQIAQKIVKLMERDINGVVHVGGPRRTVYEYAKSIDPSRDIGELSINDMPFSLPIDTSLSTGLYDRLTSS